LADERVNSEEVASVVSLNDSLVLWCRNHLVLFSEKEIFGIADQKWLIDNSLHLSLGRGRVGSSEDLHLISGLDLDTSVLRVLIIEGGEETVVIETVVSSVLHELDVLLTSVTGRSCFGSISHDGDLLVRILILNDDSGCYWIEVRSNIVS